MAILQELARVVVDYCARKVREELKWVASSCRLLRGWAAARYFYGYEEMLQPRSCALGQRVVLCDGWRAAALAFVAGVGNM